MTARRLLHRLFYFTIEDETILAEAFSAFEEQFYAIAYKVAGSEDVFVTTTETKEAMDRYDVPYNLLGEEDASRVAIYHSPQSREELGDYENALKALALAYRAIGLVCMGVNGEVELGGELAKAARSFTYFTAPAGHTFIWRLVRERREAMDFLDRRTAGDRKAVEWAKSLPLGSSEELAGYH
jgi:hypothetical protein